MITTNELLDQVKTKLGLPSDYKLAQVLDISKSAITNYRKQTTHPDQAVCLRIAEILEVDPDVILCNVQAERTKDETLSTQWARIAERLEGLSSTALALFLALFVSHHPDAGAAVQSEKSEHVLTVKANEYEVLRESVYYVN
jgi:transcriptional regulator with XRE-family HTH domain